MHQNPQSITNIIQGNQYKTENMADTKLTQLVAHEGLGTETSFDKLAKQVLHAEGLFVDEGKLGSLVKDVYEAIKQENAKVGEYSEEKAFGRLFKALYIAVLKQNKSGKSLDPPTTMMFANNNSIKNSSALPHSSYLNQLQTTPQQTR